MTPAGHGIWSTEELGTLANAPDVDTLRRQMLGTIVPVIYRRFMSEFRETGVVPVDPASYVDIF